jgi:hypothetical protein
MHTCTSNSPAPEKTCQRLGLGARVLEDRRFAADGSVAMGGLRCAAPRDQRGERPLGEEAKRQPENIRIGKEVEQKRAHRLQGIRPTQVAQHHRDTL